MSLRSSTQNSPFDSETPLEFTDVDDTATMGTFPDPALGIPGFDPEKDALGDDFRNLCDRANRTSNGGGCQMANVDLHSNADGAGRQGGSNS